MPVLGLSRPDGKLRFQRHLLSDGTPAFAVSEWPARTSPRRISHRPGRKGHEGDPQGVCCFPVFGPRRTGHPSRRPRIRDFLWSAFLQRHLGQATASTPGKSRPDVIVYKGVYPGWPWITSAADGTLYCVFREGTVHDYSANGKVLLCRSTNHGQTWSPAQVVVETPEVDDRNAAIAVLPGGDLLVTYNTYTRSRASQAMATRLRDGGTTWTQPQSLGEPNTRTRSACACWPMAICYCPTTLLRATAPGGLVAGQRQELENRPGARYRGFYRR